MSDLKPIEKIKFEKLFEMEGGYPCNFSDKTFGNFVLDSVGIDVYTNGYDEMGTSKANRLRNFWKKESNYLTAKLLEDMLEYWRIQQMTDDSPWNNTNRKEYNQKLHDECLEIAKRLKQNISIENVDVLSSANGRKSNELLIKSIQDSIKKDMPDEAIDRLHTYMVNYVRKLCDERSISYKKDTSLHNLFGLYVKYLTDNKFVESEMCLRILKSSISLLDAFNTVRNNHSLAHDNRVLNYEESVLIFNNILNIIKFIQSIDKKDVSGEERVGDTTELNITPF